MNEGKKIYHNDDHNLKCWTIILNLIDNDTKLK
jgi:hypothetical protein